jgi:hypothetical protein
MTGDEQVYALFVQANPVPDPDALPLTLETSAPLLHAVEERKGTMLTEERSRVEEPQQKNRGLRPLAVVAAAFVIVLALGAGVWWLTGGDPTPVAAEDADTVVTFDGEVIGYDGPELIQSGLVNFTLINEFDESAMLAAWRFPTRAALDAEIARVPVGTDMALEPGSPMPTGLGEIGLDAPAGQEDSTMYLLPVGWYLMDVVTTADGYNDHVWRADVIVEVVEVVEE